MIFLIYFLLFCLSILVIHKQSTSDLLLRLIDQPNKRSSHTSPTRSAGGLSIILMFLLGLYILRYLFPDLLQGRMIMLLCAVLIGVVGLVDDYIHIPAIFRLLTQFALAFIALYNLSTSWQVFEHGLSSASILSMSFFVFSLIAFVWLINLYNFMDGIDGYATFQTIFVCAFASVLVFFGTDSATGIGSYSIVLWMILLAIIMLAFTPFNWPKAKLFMGDTGSGFLGFITGCFVVVTIIEQHLSIQTWMVLLAVFVADSTLALIRRFMSGKKIYEAHRSHAYQNMSRKYKSHMLVTIAAILINVVLIAPAAFISHTYSELGNVIVFLVYFLILVLFYLAGSGVSGLYEVNE